GHGCDPEAPFEETTDVDGRQEFFPRADEVVQANESDNAVEVSLEAPLLPELLEDGAGRLQIATELAEPGLGEHRQLVHIRVALAVSRGHSTAHCPSVRWTTRDVELERLLQRHVGGGLLDEALTHREELPGAAPRVLRHAKHGLEVHARKLAGGRPTRLELRVPGERQRELATDVLDLRIEPQGLEVVGLLLEERRHLCLGLDQLAELHEHTRVLQTLLALDRYVDHLCILPAGITA